MSRNRRLSGYWTEVKKSAHGLLSVMDNPLSELSHVERERDMLLRVLGGEVDGSYGPTCASCIHGTRVLDANHRKCMVDGGAMPVYGTCGDFTPDIDAEVSP